MRGLKVAVVAMGVLIVVGVVGLVAAVAYRSASRTTSVASQAAGVAPAGAVLPNLLPDLMLDEPAGSRIAAMGQGDGRTLLLVQGGGPDRVVVVDGRTGQVVQRVRLAR